MALQVLFTAALTSFESPVAALLHERRHALLVAAELGTRRVDVGFKPIHVCCS